MCCRGGRYERRDELMAAPRLDPGDELVGLHGIPDLRCGLASKAHPPDRVAVTKMTYAGAGVRYSLRHAALSYASSLSLPCDPGGTP
jgi:hypothetical protein